MSLRDRIARVLCANSPANTEGSAFEDYAECNQREWLDTADALLSDPEIAALRELYLLSPKPAPIPEPKCWHCSYRGPTVVKFCMREGAV